MGLSMEAEAWMWYGIAMTIILLRYISRYIHFGTFKKFQIEDYVMGLVTIFYTLLIVYLTKLDTLPTNLVPPDEVNEITASSIPSRIEGSKLVIVVEQLWCATIWGCKASLLLLYRTLTNNSSHRYLVYGVAAYTAFGYVLMIILFFGVWCRPFSQYWAVPVQNQQCATYHDHLIVNTVFNISSDVLMLCIPLPLFIRTQLPLKKKIILCGVFSLGAFVIICAVLSKFYSFSLPYGVDWVWWYVREVSTAVIVANIPHCWALCRKIFNVRAFLSNGTSQQRSRLGLSGYGKHSVLQSSSHHGPATQTSNINRSHSQWYKMKIMGQVNEVKDDLELSRSGSEEHINTQPLEIYHNQQYSVEEEKSTAGRSADVDSMEKGEGKRSQEIDIEDGWKGTQTTVSALPPSHSR